jgi:hypothetical protein
MPSLVSTAPLPRKTRQRFADWGNGTSEDRPHTYIASTQMPCGQSIRRGSSWGNADCRQRHSGGAELLFHIYDLCNARLGMYPVSSLVILYIILVDIGVFQICI